MIVKVKDLKANPNNPRYIRDAKFEKLKKSIQDFPEMLKLRPVVVDDNMMVLGGNMRLKALKELGIDEVEIIKAKDLTEKQKAEFIIKDNVGFGDWDWDMLANGGWDEKILNDWGLSVWTPEEDIDKFEPNLIPETTYSDVTKEEIQKQAQKLATQMLKQNKGKECICPNCGEEFQIYE